MHIDVRYGAPAEYAPSVAWDIVILLQRREEAGMRVREIGKVCWLRTQPKKSNEKVVSDNPPDDLTRKIEVGIGCNSQTNLIQPKFSIHASIAEICLDPNSKEALLMPCFRFRRVKYSGSAVNTRRGVGHIARGFKNGDYIITGR